MFFWQSWSHELGCGSSCRFWLTQARPLECASPYFARYLIMEFCSGGELFDHIVEQGRVKEAEVPEFKAFKLP